MRRWKRRMKKRMRGLWKQGGEEGGEAKLVGVDGKRGRVMEEN